MSWSRAQWQAAAAIASCLIGTVLLILPSVWARMGQETPPAAAASPATAPRPQASPAAPRRAAPVPAPQGSSPTQARIPPAPDLAIASADDQAKALELARQAKALLDKYSGDTRLLGQAEGLIEAALKADGRCAEALIEQSRFRMKYGGSLSPPVLLAAETPLRHGLAYHPDHGNTLVLLGYVLTHQRRFDEAAQAFDTARRVKADSPWLELNTGEMLLMQGRTEDGLDRYEAALQDPKVPRAVKDWATEEMARHLAKMGQGEKAVAAYDKLIASGRSGAWTFGHYSRVLRVNLIDTKRSVEMGRRALKRMDYGWGRDNLGRSLYMLWAEALIVDKDEKKADNLYAEAQQYLPDPRALAEEFSRFPRAHPILEAFKREGYPLSRLGRGPSSTSQLLLAVDNANAGGLKALLDAGADPNLASHQDRATPLQRAAQAGNAELVQLLLAGGAEPRLRDAGGRDAETLARQAGHESVAALLAQARRPPPGPVVKTGMDSEGMPLAGFRYRLLQDQGRPPFGALKGAEATFQTIADGNGRGRVTLVFETAYGRPPLTLEQASDSRDWTAVFSVIAEP